MFPGAVFIALGAIIRNVKVGLYISRDSYWFGNNNTWAVAVCSHPPWGLGGAPPCYLFTFRDHYKARRCFHLRALGYNDMYAYH